MLPKLRVAAMAASHRQICAVGLPFLYCKSVQQKPASGIKSDNTVSYHVTCVIHANKLLPCAAGQAWASRQQRARVQRTLYLISNGHSLHVLKQQLVRS